MNGTPAASSAFAKKVVQLLDEDSTSNQHLWNVDAF